MSTEKARLQFQILSGTKALSFGGDFEGFDRPYNIYILRKEGKFAVLTLLKL